jgi:hypothetical protein
MKRVIFTLLVLASLGTASLKAQVTIGSEIAPRKAALLDLKEKSSVIGDTTSATHGGLILPRVALVSLTTLQPFILTTDDEWNYNNAALHHVGLTVYNTTRNTELTPGLYYWDGYKWVKPAPTGSRLKTFTLTQNSVNYFIDTDVDLVLNPSFYDGRVTLPTTGVEVGRIIWIIDVEPQALTSLRKPDGTQIVGGDYLINFGGGGNLVGGESGNMYIYIGGGKWFHRVMY